ncbi:dihydroxyacetone kinase subunit DhaK [Prescottella agglutinans]|uniref:Dihydroxyacetone kinase-like protein n=1 Tax=Prescottella agglutinans TaxID=1644129 RepID=A0ABT6M996_9NOCA|nr:dihydroxyacetone kinase subunit DhaK [Prescottella agglutinans]MDH6279969.1 dihydroxyacetone kinase-like protein [Prescottella agglutinans]
MTTRHFVNEPEDVTREALEGLQLLYPDMIVCHTDPSYVVRAGHRREKVALVSGGGAGHEPLHTQFVGIGMLDAAVPGAVFSSPTALQVRAAVQAVETGQGALLIVKNYTGDMLNFSIAAELLIDERATEIVVVDDDLATGGVSDDGPGRRGTAAVLAVEKICGAAAERGWTLSGVAELGRRIVASSSTLSVALRAGTPPGHARPSFDLADDEIEFGVGIHGERGRGTRPLVAVGALVDDLVEQLVDGGRVSKGDNVIAIVNGLGATHAIELAIATRELVRALDRRGIAHARLLSGSFVTSFDMHGLSITLVRVSDDFVELWDDPVRTPALTW